MSLLALLLACSSPEGRVDPCARAAQIGVAPAPQADSGLIYEAYVRSFQDSDGDGTGDLRGLRARLDHLVDLGVETLWLMPIFPSPGPAGYDVSDFNRVTEAYGTEQDLVDLASAAEERGIRLMLDVPINHTSSEHPWFQAGSADAEHDAHGAYLFSHEQWDELRWHRNQSIDDSWYYAYFGPDFPDLDWTSPLVVESLPASLARWIDRGVGGVRLDAVRQLVEDDGLISDTAAGHCTLEWLYADLARQDVLVLAEAWSRDLETVTPYLGTDARPQADLALGVPRQEATAQAFAQGAARVLAEALDAEAQAGVLHRMAQHVGSHDQPRFRDRIPDAAVRRAWMVLLLTLPGAPILYYGDEIDLRGADKDQEQDLPWRAPMAWDGEAWGGFTTGTPWMAPAPDYLEGQHVAGQAADPWSMLRLLYGLADLRDASAALRGGELVLYDASEPAVLAFERAPLDPADPAVLVVVNLGAQDLRSVVVEGAGTAPWYDLSADGRQRHPGAAGLDLPAHGYAVLTPLDLPGVRVPGPVPRVGAL